MIPYKLVEIQLIEDEIKLKLKAGLELLTVSQGLKSGLKGAVAMTDINRLLTIN